MGHQWQLDTNYVRHKTVKKIFCYSCRHYKTKKHPLNLKCVVFCIKYSMMYYSVSFMQILLKVFILKLVVASCWTYSLYQIKTNMQFCLINFSLGVILIQCFSVYASQFRMVSFFITDNFNLLFSVCASQYIYNNWILFFIRDNFNPLFSVYIYLLV